jgi:hypothetical protein
LTGYTALLRLTSPPPRPGLDTSSLAVRLSFLYLRLLLK